MRVLYLPPSPNGSWSLSVRGLNGRRAGRTGPRSPCVWRRAWAICLPPDHAQEHASMSRRSGGVGVRPRGCVRNHSTVVYACSSSAVRSQVTIRRALVCRHDTDLAASAVPTHRFLASILLRWSPLYALALAPSVPPRQQRHAGCRRQTTASAARYLVTAPSCASARRGALQGAQFERA
jgi:hypothetical protein